MPWTVHPPHTAPSRPKPGILIVDDDPMLLPLLRAVCEDRGFRVWTAPGGAEGVRLYQEAGDEIDLVLLDVRMPGLDGPATFARLRQEDPAVVCCFMSGYSGAHTPAELLARGAARFFDKPFRVNDLAGELWELAGARGRCPA